MLTKLKNLRTEKSEQGFTIIEVVIVLAIAGLIILVVLLAVPALQRNGRNTTMKSDASAVTGALSEFKSNNEGRSVTSITGSAPDYNFTNTTITGVAPVAFKVQPSTTVTVQPVSVAPALYIEATNGIIYVVPQAKCKATNYAATTDLDVTAGAKRSTAVIYPVEQPSGSVPVARCIEA